MQYTVRLPNARSLLVPIVAFAVGAGGATITHAAIDGASFDLSSDDSPAAKQGSPAPHDGVGGPAVEPPAPSTAHKGGGPPAEESPAQEAAEAARTHPHGPAASFHSPQR
jgi:hypothetical protein